ncbi:MAG: ATP-dependent DNA helicase RecG [Parvularculales bacterium]
MTTSGFKHFKRPEPLFRLFAPLTALPGVGDKLASVISKRVGSHVIDLLRHLPCGVIDRSKRPAISQIEHGSIVTLEVEITGHDKPPRRSRRPWRVAAQNKTGRVDLVFFHARGDYVEKLLPLGARRIVSGRAEMFKDKVQIAHPDHVIAPDKEDDMPRYEPVYPLTAGLTAKTMAKAMKAALEGIPELDEWINPDIVNRFGWPEWAKAARSVHSPHSDADLMPNSPERARLAYDELLANQLALALVRIGSGVDEGRAFPDQATDGLAAELTRNLPFELTPAQLRVIDEIRADQIAPRRMLRLLQGDVGSGKTVVALLAMLHVVSGGAQAALLVPTEILARQHHATLTGFLAPLGITPGLLHSKMKAGKKRDVLAALADGTMPIVVGTHALLSDNVSFNDLGLAVVDEQHRFGVRQRLVLGDKAKGVDVLVMTATPIPRTLAMTAYGDLVASQIDEKPPGRKPVITTAVPLDRSDDVIERLRGAIKAGKQAYWICPLIDESDSLDIAAAEGRHTELRTALPEAATGLVHGKMNAESRDTAMESFRSGESRLLVATTVIEVGVDVPNASIMIIEHAERFGLAQMHQLRGRVGRGDDQSSCLLLYKAPVSETARARLSIMRESDDGFRIAEEDLRLRGPGEVLGQRQSGDPDFILADLAHHGDLLALAHDEAEGILSRNPMLSGDEGTRLKLLLSLFERDMAVTYLAGG